MTRINAGIHPSKLLDSHLFAEFRELPRIFSIIINGKNKSLPGSQFSLNKGHVCFFYDKLSYLDDRYQMIIREMNIRELNYNKDLPNQIINEYRTILNQPQFIHLWNDWYDADAAPILNQRLLEKFETMTQGKFRYHKKPVDKEFAKELLFRSN